VGWDEGKNRPLLADVVDGGVAPMGDMVGKYVAVVVNWMKMGRRV